MVHRALWPGQGSWVTLHSPLCSATVRMAVCSQLGVSVKGCESLQEHLWFVLLVSSLLVDSATLSLDLTGLGCLQ